MSLEDKLRDEILDAQRFQSELSKWKLILLAGIGAAALGFVPGAKDVSATMRLAMLALMPLVCIYADALSFQATARIMKIARYFRMRRSEHGYGDREYDHYEVWCSKNREYSGTENLAMFGVSLAASIVVGVIGLFGVTCGILRLPLDGISPWPIAALGLSGVAGIVGSLRIRRHHNRVFDALNHGGEEYPPPPAVTDQMPPLPKEAFDPAHKLNVEGATEQSSH